MHLSLSYSDANAKRNAYDVPKVTFAGSPSALDARVPPTLRPHLSAPQPPAASDGMVGTDARGFSAPADMPTWSGTEGVRFDFNDGCRVLLPDGDWTVRLRDMHTDTPLFDTQIGAGIVTSTRKHFVPFLIEIDVNGKRVFKHRFDAHGKPVLIQFEAGRLGEALGWFGYAVKFQRRHRCKLTCSMPAPLISLLKPGYPDIEFMTPDLVNPECYYATYRLGRFVGDEARAYQPSAPQLVGMHRSAAYMLGVDPREAPPRIELKDDSPPLASRYVCVAAQSALRCARWERPGGWRELQRFLTAAGYRIVCVDSPSPDVVDESSALADAAHCLPPDTPWTERARWLRHAACLIGVPGDLSWLAWAVGTPVVLISGFTHPVSEFDTPYRVINFHACNSCWNDASASFDDADASSCPRHAGTLRQFECARLVSVEQIKHAIRSIPGIAG
ncbi:autotransporter strand-loop-strand O-heptosyltransferase [Burkholderia mayonis]|uniref:Autotransporter strand-loop-strand O-heptosyltransferase n=1 Tax=Burkholderia mayonis TaxID=1385591 RepID=A0A1B4G2P0_9BURK|nr:autotransporter strand-loop-strand O-heptosyltransferase [Burkholderia mayonis]AOJ10199.1 autotransporter strand-loop-strand O-heptosyltransferase [Burkholderia mayonis]KVE53817.1 autotransporter strand-loop-strand O-heptosyltransferase [Burkholderia mayonis]